MRLWDQASVVVDNGFEIVGEAQESAQFIVDACISAYQPMKLCVGAAMRFDRAPGPFGDQCLSRMKGGKIGCTSGFVWPSLQHSVRLSQASASLANESGGFRRQSSTPSRRISRINGVRSL